MTRRDPDPRPLVLLPKTSKRGRRLAQDLGFVEQSAAIGGERVAAFAAVEQGQAQGPLQRGEAARQGRRRDAGGLCRAREPTGVGDSKEQGKVVKTGSMFHL